MNTKKGRSSALFHFEVNGFDYALHMPGTGASKPEQRCACPLTAPQSRANDSANS